MYIGLNPALTQIRGRTSTLIILDDIETIVNVSSGQRLTGTSPTYAIFEDYFYERITWRYAYVVPKHWRWYDKFRTWAPVLIPQLSRGYGLCHQNIRTAISIKQRASTKRKMYIQKFYQRRNK